MKGQDIREQFGVNQWLEQSRVITSLDLAKRADVLPGLRQVHWDLVIVDEAHRMSASDESHKSLRYKLGELLRDTSDHMLLLTAAAPTRSARCSRPSRSAAPISCVLPTPFSRCIRRGAKRSD
jgi:hypothetical protein